MVCAGGRRVNVGGKATVDVEAGDRLLLLTPGGGGYGAPEPQPSDDNHNDPANPSKRSKLSASS